MQFPENTKNKRPRNENRSMAVGGISKDREEKLDTAKDKTGLNMPSWVQCSQSPPGIAT
jgi:peroxiredoxin